MRVVTGEVERGAGHRPGRLVRRLPCSSAWVRRSGLARWSSRLRQSPRRRPPRTEAGMPQNMKRLEALGFCSLSPRRLARSLLRNVRPTTTILPAARARDDEPPQPRRGRSRGRFSAAEPGRFRPFGSCGRVSPTACWAAWAIVGRCVSGSAPTIKSKITPNQQTGSRASSEANRSRLACAHLRRLHTSFAGLAGLTSTPDCVACVYKAQYPQIITAADGEL